GRLSGGLRGEGGGLTGTAEAQAAGGGPGQGVALKIGDSHHGVVEGGADMHLALLYVLTLAALAHHFLTLGIRSHVLSLLTSSCWRRYAWDLCGYGRWSWSAGRERAAPCGDGRHGSSRSRSGA